MSFWNRQEKQQYTFSSESKSHEQFYSLLFTPTSYARDVLRDISRDSGAVSSTRQLSADNEHLFPPLSEL